MRRRRYTIEDLRRVIDCLPVRTREAMLEGIRSNEIIVGAYCDREGGICPMLAAHRNGGRTNFISFARAWDRFAGARHARKATRRELLVLESHLEMSLDGDPGAQDLDLAIADHQAISRDRRAREAAESGSWGFLSERRETRAAKRALELVEDERELEHV